MLELLLGSGAAVKVLGVVLFREPLYLRDIARAAGVSPSEAKRELEKLVLTGVLLSSRKGNLRIFSLNPGCAFLDELKGLYLKTEGVFNTLRERLSAREDVDCAFVYGSMATGDYGKGSDLDLMVIGSIAEQELEGLLFSVQKKSSREINHIHWTAGELKRKLAQKSGFLKSMMGKKRIWLKGDENELERVAKKRVG